MENNFFKFLEEIFALSKLRNDIERYIEYREGEENYVSASHEFENEEKKLEYKRSDAITLISIRINKGFNGILFIPFYN